MPRCRARVKNRSTRACLVLRWQPTRGDLTGGIAMTAGYGARLLSLCLLVLAACTATTPGGSSAPAKPAAAAPTAAPAAAPPAASAATAAPVAQRTRVIAGYIPAIAAAAYYL